MGRFDSFAFPPNIFKTRSMLSSLSLHASSVLWCAFTPPLGYILTPGDAAWISRLSVLTLWAACLLIPAAVAHCYHIRVRLAKEIQRRKDAEHALKESELKLQCVVDEHCQIALSREAELDESQNRLINKRLILGAVLESIGEGVVVCNREGEFTWVNSAAVQLVPMLCQSPHYQGEWVNSDVRVLNNEGVRLWSEHMPLARAMRGELVDNAEIQIFEGDKRLRWLNVTARPLPKETGGAVATFHDITATKDAFERMGEARDQAVRASRVKSEFLAVMSHELRTPLTGVRGMLEHLQSCCLQQDQAEYAQVALNCSDSLLHLIDDILDLSKIEAGKLQLRVVPFELSPLLDTIVDMFGPDLMQRPLELKVEYAAESPEWFTGDSARLRQILVNLVGNAVKYSEQGTVTLRARATQEGLRCEVEDQGPGIPESLRESLFEAFTQGDSSSKRHFGGVGLGLSIVSRLVALLGGKIGYESEIGRGTRFEVLLPYFPCSAPEVEDEGTTGFDGDLSSLRLLVVEDNPINRRVLGLQLGKLGVGEILYAEDGEQALEVAARHPGGVILLDCQMPGIDGIEVAKRLREDRETYGNPVVIALTAHALAKERERCLAAGMDEFLTKPLAFEALRATLLRWVPVWNSRLMGDLD